MKTYSLRLRNALRLVASRELLHLLATAPSVNLQEIMMALSSVLCHRASFSGARLLLFSVEPLEALDDLCYLDAKDHSKVLRRMSKELKRQSRRG